MRLRDRRSIITAGGAGLGLETARRVRPEGARVGIVNRAPTSLQPARLVLPQPAILEVDGGGATHGWRRRQR